MDECNTSVWLVFISSLEDSSCIHSALCGTWYKEDESKTSIFILLSLSSPADIMQNQFFPLFSAKLGKVKKVCKLHAGVEGSGEHEQAELKWILVSGQNEIVWLKSVPSSSLQDSLSLCTQFYAIRSFHLHLCVFVSFWTALGPAVLFMH
jgi:hypothetical protein